MSSNIERTLATLEMLARVSDGVRVTDLADALGLNRAIPHRILAELVALGYVIQDPRTERYRATFKLGSLGLRQIETAGAPRWAQDELDCLAVATRELVRVAVVTGHDSLRFMFKAQGAATGLMVDSVSGAEVVLHATASGKAWLSTLPEDQAAAILDARGLRAQTGRTETDLDRLLAEIASARRDGYAITQEEMEVGISAVAVAIVPPERDDGQGVATVSVAGPAARLTAEALVGFVPALREVATRLAARWHAYAYLTALSPVATARAGDAG